MTQGEHMAQKAKWTIGSVFLVLFLGLAVVSIFSHLLAFLGIIERRPHVRIEQANEKWDNKACLRNEQYRIRELDPLISDDMLFSEVARNCVVLKEEWNNSH